jgi:hypothetical protein
MWYTVLKDDVPIGFVELASGALVAAPMLSLPAYDTIGSTTRLATHAFLQLGVFGGALPAVPPFPGELLRLRRCLSRAARLQLVLVDARGAAADTSFVNLLQSAETDSVALIAGFGKASAHIGALLSPRPAIQSG